MNSLKLILPGCAFALISVNLHANTPIFSESFDTADSISTWTGEPVWSATAGNPGGAVLVSNNTPPGNVNYTVEFPLELSETSEVTVTFDAIKVAEFAGVFHFYAELGFRDQFFINFNVEADINFNGFTELTFTVPDVPATATSMTLRFEMVTGAEGTANITVAIDNLVVSGPATDPPGTWKGYTLVDGFWVENVGQLGWINVELDPWLWSSYLNEWVYMPEGSTPGTKGVWFYMAPAN